MSSAFISPAFGGSSFRDCHFIAPWLCFFVIRQNTSGKLYSEVEIILLGKLSLMLFIHSCTKHKKDIFCQSKSLLWIRKRTLFLRKFKIMWKVGEL